MLYGIHFRKIEDLQQRFKEVYDFAKRKKTRVDIDEAGI